MCLWGSVGPLSQACWHSIECGGELPRSVVGGMMSPEDVVDLVSRRSHKGFVSRVLRCGVLHTILGGRVSVKVGQESLSREWSQ